MINKGWLSNYHSRELQEYLKFQKNRIKPKFLESIKYPDQSRFPKLSNPCASIAGSNIWSRIPLFGTSFIGLPPWPQERYLEQYGFGTDEDFRNLMNLSRMGKVQFTLTTSPLEYIDCDFLEDLLREFEPPYMYETGLVDIDGEGKIDYDEFVNAAKQSFIPALSSIYSHSSPRHLQKRIDDYASDYIMLKKLGYEIIAEEILKNMHKPEIVNAYCTIFGNLIVHPVLDPLKMSYDAMHCDVRSDYDEFLNLLNPNIIENTTPLEKIILPGEIGYFLMNKLTYLPETYEAALALMDRYAQDDLYNLMNSLQDGFKQNNVDIITSKSNEISLVFDTLWNDGKNIKRLSNRINYGFSISIGAIGALVTLPLGGVGALAGLGFGVADRTLPLISENISKRLSPNHSVMMFDFKTKYNIKD